MPQRRGYQDDVRIIREDCGKWSTLWFLTKNIMDPAVFSSLHAKFLRSNCRHGIDRTFRNSAQSCCILSPSLAMPHRLPDTGEERKTARVAGERRRQELLSYVWLPHESTASV